MAKFFIRLIKIYQYTFTVLFGNCCRFHPSCSSYSILALQRFGLLRGGWFMFKRILCCHPWHQGGIDLVPEKNHEH